MDAGYGSGGIGYYKSIIIQKMELFCMVMESTASKHVTILDH